MPGCTDPDCTIGYGFCHDGCGQRTKPASQTHRKRKVVQGEPQLYVVGHRVDKRQRDGAHFMLETDRQERIFVLYVLERLTEREIAARRGVSVGTVRADRQELGIETRRSGGREQVALAGVLTVEERRERVFVLYV